MLELGRERLTGWGTRVSFAVVLLICSEWGVWQTPLDFGALRWIAIGVIYVALAGITLDLIARFTVNEVLSLFLVAGIYGLLNGTLISHITSRDLPVSLIVRPLSAQPLVFMLAMGVFLLLASDRATGPLDMIVAVAAGLIWGIWVRWFPEVSEEAIPAVDIGEAVAALAVLLVVCGVIRFVFPPAALYRREDWLLNPVEWALASGVLLAALLAGSADDSISSPGIAIVVTLVAYLGTLLFISQNLRRGDSLLGTITPPRRPNIVAWLVVVVPFLMAGWAGYHLPGGDDGSLQSDVLFGALTGVGIVWLPAISAVLGVRAFMQLTREGF